MQTYHLNGSQVGSGIQMELSAPGVTATSDGSKTDYDFSKVINIAEVTVSSAELLALAASPKTVVADPGDGYVLEFISAILILDKGATAYDDAAADGDLVIRYTDGSGAIASTTLDADGFIDGATDQIRTLKPITTDLTPVASSPLVLDNTGDEFTGGDGVLRVKVAYRIYPTGL